MNIPDSVINELELWRVHDINLDDWMSVKKYLLRSIPIVDRKLFSTRDSKTKRQEINDFEKEIIQYYEIQTGKKLRLPDNVIL